MRWIVGSNLPGRPLDDHQTEHDTWPDAWQALGMRINHMHEANLVNADEEAEQNLTADHQAAMTVWLGADEDTTVAVVYGGRVWWLTDMADEPVTVVGEVVT